MKIAWFCIPAHGHTNPTLRLVHEMVNAGHQVYYFSFAQFKEKIEAAGAVYISCDGYDFPMEDAGNSDRVGKDIAYSMELVVSSTLALDQMVAEKVEELKPDLIVSDSVAFWGKLAAMKHGIPYVSSTTTFAFNQYSAKYMKQSPLSFVKMMMDMPKVNRQMNRLREHGYPVNSFLDIIQNDNSTNTIVYTSKYFQPCADTFSETYRFIGPSIRPMTDHYEKNAEKTIYLSLGTVNENDALLRHCINALGKTDWQVILSLGDRAKEFDALPENIAVYDFVDQMAVLSIADVFITHCGMNSVSEALYFEVPLLLCPQTSEQGAVAKRVTELGAGILLQRDAEEEILAALNRLLSDPYYKNHAKMISESFHACGGVQEAKAFLESIRDKTKETF